ncbi:hypothetical protein [Candidatus Halobonum tyrrellensis]|uniref:Uncharacterized protein n=1 Tax=Candidatus Halobonum tyrrellensis G22 TaxID=1324957 RepID=V4GSP4_9EURY|nr:hypothetical protein [Candidatus Halobonum tyrrellensis]ESP88116.1 hypothetical protein K933_10512 [Candidatus Halobonum tyrrellensis G22]
MNHAVSVREAVSTGAVGGAAVAATGAVGYVVVPLLAAVNAGRVGGAVDAMFVVFEAVFGPLRWVAVLVVPAALAACWRLRALRRRGAPSLRDDLWVGAGVVAAAYAGAVACYVLLSVGAGVAAATYVGASADAVGFLGEAAILVVGLLVYALPFTVVVLLVVVAGASVGAGVGVLVVRAADRRRSRPAGRANGGGAG